MEEAGECHQCIVYSRASNEPSRRLREVLKTWRRPLLGLKCKRVVVVGAFNREKALIGAFAVIVKTMLMVRLQP